MNRLISKKIQLLITCIPYVNCFMIFIWLYNCYHSTDSAKIFPKSLLIVFLHSIPLVILQIIVSSIFVKFGPIIDSIMFYCIPLSIGLGLIRYQIKLGLKI